MPLGEAVGEFFFRAVLEIVLHGLLFGFGYLFLKLISLGRLPLAPFSTFGDRNSSEKKFWSWKWSIWLKCGKHGRAIKAEFVTLVGLVVTAGVAVFYYLVR